MPAVYGLGMFSICFDHTLPCPSLFITTQSCRHIRIYQQSEFGFFIEQLGGNGSFLNSQQLKKGDVRTLQHGDEISVLNYGQSVPDAPAENQPFAVFVFRYAEPTRRSDSYEPRKRLKVEADEACDMMATLGGPGLAGDEGDIDGTALSTEEAFQANYDMRIGIDTLIGKAGPRCLQRSVTFDVTNAYKCFIRRTRHCHTDSFDGLYRPMLSICVYEYIDK